MERNATENSVTFTRMGMDALPHPEDEEDVVEFNTFEELDRTAAGVAEEATKKTEQDISLEKEDLYSVEEEPKGLAVANAALD